MATPAAHVDFCHVDHIRINYTQQIGSGTFGTVYKGIDKETGIPVAAKYIRLSKGKKDEALALKEILANQALSDHNNLVKMIHYKHDTTKGRMWVFTQYYKNGDLVKYVKNNEIDLETALTILHGCAKGLEYMNNKPDGNVIHRDVKPRNILISKKYGNLVVAKLADFGLAKVKSSESSMMMTGLGTSFYQAPEFFQSITQYDKSIDAFAFAVVILQMIRVLVTGERDMESEEGNMTLIYT